jgi:SAM-dependent methyltransferase
MGIYKPDFYIFDHYLKLFLQLRQTSPNNLSMLELGNQYIYNPLLGRTDGEWSLSKPYFVDKGYKHTSIDINGKDGALQLDLSKPFEPELISAFDIVTNFGTSEHVEDNQYICWKNIHEALKSSGYLFCTVPKAKEFHPQHSPWYHTVEFFNYFAEALKYRRWFVGEFLSPEPEYGVVVLAALYKENHVSFNAVDGHKLMSHLYKNPGSYQSFI